jgi:cytoskeletal protein RodZ
MENNTVNNNSQSQNIAPPQVSQPNLDPVVNNEVTGYTESHSNKLFFVVMGILILILVTLASLFFYNQSQTVNNKEVAPSTKELTISQPPTPIPTQEPSNSTVDEEEALQELTLPDLDKELSDLDAELNNL